MVISIQGLEWSHVFFRNTVGKWFMVSSKIAPEDSKPEVLLDIQKWSY